VHFSVVKKHTTTADMLSYVKARRIYQIDCCSNGVYVALFHAKKLLLKQVNYINTTNQYQNQRRWL